MVLNQVDYVQSNLELRIGIGHWGLVFGILIGVLDCGLWISIGTGAQESDWGIRIGYYDYWDQGIGLELQNKIFGLEILIRNYGLGLGMGIAIGCYNGRSGFALGDWTFDQRVRMMIGKGDEDWLLRCLGLELLIWCFAYGLGTGFRKKHFPLFLVGLS